ncbi:MAG TPA: GH3 auxin-responsive promoter family protein, partial [Taishania sp.]|nr:GH3 auxin-responsive promoter family protein [Taishania sp.]
VYMNDTTKGAHQWLIEFINHPNDLRNFQRLLDHTLKDLNSDYEAKRYKDLILQEPQLKILPTGAFDVWLKSNNKLGGQNKVPRLANNREIAEQILESNQLQ